MAPLAVLLVFLSIAPALVPSGLPPGASAASSTLPTPRLPTTTVSPSPPALRPPTVSPRPPTTAPSKTSALPHAPLALPLKSSISPPPRIPSTANNFPKMASSPGLRAASSSPTTPRPPFTSSPTVSLGNTTATLPPTAQPPTPSPEQLVARIRALVRALRDADQLLRALQVFRDQHQFGEDAVLRVMKEDANRTLAEQVEHAMVRDETVASIMNNTSSAKYLSAKVVYTAYGKKSAKFVQGQDLSDGKPVAAVGKPKNGVADAASTRTTTRSTTRSTTRTTPRLTPKALAASTSPTLFSSKTVRNGTVITRIKNDPILGEYKVVIRDLTPAESSGITPTRNCSEAQDSVGGNAKTDKIPAGVVTGASPPSTERGRYRFQDTLAAPSSTAAVPAASNKSASPRPPPPVAANRRSGKSGAPQAAKGSTARPKAKGKSSTTSSPRPRSTTMVNTTMVTRMTTTATSRTSTTSKPVMAKKSLQKKASGDKQQVVVSATLRTAPPVEREEAAAKERTPLETPLLSGIFPRYGPGASLPQLEMPFVPRRGGALSADVPAIVLLPPLPPLPDRPRSKDLTPSTSPPPPTSSSSPLSSSPPPAPLPTPPTPPSSGLSPSPSPAAWEDERSAGGGGGPPQSVRLEPPLTPSLLEIPNSYFLGESPWIPLYVPNNNNENNNNNNNNKRPGDAVRTGPAPSTGTVVELTKLHVVEATAVSPTTPTGSFGAQGQTPDGGAVAQKGRGLPYDALGWRPSRTWQYAVRQDRQDTNLQDLQLQPDLRLGPGDLSLIPLSVAESIYYRLRPADLHGPGPYDGIPGVPGLDYPAYSRPPRTRFTCADFRQKGYFADPASGCQAFYVCNGDGRGESMLCPNGTVFSQEVLVCDWWFNVDCK